MRTVDYIQQRPDELQGSHAIFVILTFSLFHYISFLDIYRYFYFRIATFDIQKYRYVSIFIHDIPIINFYLLTGCVFF